MKTRNHLAVWGAVTAVSISLIALPASAAQERNAASDTSKASAAINSQRDKTLGELERANKLIGKEVRTTNNQKVGKIHDLVIDLPSGRILYAVVSLGLTSGKVGVAPGVFSDVQGNIAHINVDEQKIKDAPQFTSDIDKDTAIGSVDFVSKVFQHFGQNEWWQGSSKSSATGGSFPTVHKASDLIGMKIKNVPEQAMGDADNLMVDLPAGRLVFVILAPDSSLELGKTLYALPPDAFTSSTDRKSLVSDISKDKLASAPHFAMDNWPNLSDRTFALQVYRYYGKQAYFDTGLQPTGRSEGTVYPGSKEKSKKD